MSFFEYENSPYVIREDIYWILQVEIVGSE